MYHFIYDLFSSETDSLVRPLKALTNIKSRGKNKDSNVSAFMYQGSDDYTDETINSICTGQEVIRILQKIEKQVEEGCDHGSIVDINGNKIGSWEI